ncbi:hypothetical protein PIB30_000094 [Stylosanthes scabra]|uniref:Disease resistance protein At4g27190-like leucine-rich repeats domain-containing protein n=1 Tax=Stylosanthes scabra TaxID=79078 RepID=A0ABU6R173_9FABA|nr:hypothetical protein [Stylosanthes scabra]
MTSPSLAANLPKLEYLEIYSCDMMEEIVASENDNNEDGGALNEIAFLKLEVLKLRSLKSLKWFCKGAYTFKFPSLRTVRVNNCPRMEIFCNGNLIAPNLTVVDTSSRLSSSEKTSRWDGDLNTTIKNIFTHKQARSLLPKLPVKIDEGGSISSPNALSHNNSETGSTSLNSN